MSISSNFLKTKLIQFSIRELLNRNFFLGGEPKKYNLRSNSILLGKRNGVFVIDTGLTVLELRKSLGFLSNLFFRFFNSQCLFYFKDSTIKNFFKKNVSSFIPEDKISSKNIKYFKEQAFFCGSWRGGLISNGNSFFKVYNSTLYKKCISFDFDFDKKSILDLKFYFFDTQNLFVLKNKPSVIISFSENDMLSKEANSLGVPCISVIESGNFNPNVDYAINSNTSRSLFKLYFFLYKGSIFYGRLFKLYSLILKNDVLDSAYFLKFFEKNSKKTKIRKNIKQTKDLNKYLNFIRCRT